MNGHKRHIQWKPIPLNSKVIQIYSKGLEYALVSNDLKQCHNFIWCKDFLHDVIYSTLNNKPIEIYQFKYNPEKNPQPSLDKIKLLITNSKDKKFEQKIPACLDFVNQIEKRMKIKKSIVRKCWLPPEPYNISGVFLFEGSKRWLQAPPMISLYSLLLRIGLSHTIGNKFENTIEGIKNETIKCYQKNDRKWLINITAGLEKIFRIGDRRIFSKNIYENYPKKFMIDTIHNRMGIIGFSSEVLCASLGDSVIVPHWHFIK